jgi:hypothetical protein
MVVVDIEYFIQPDLVILCHQQSGMRLVKNNSKDRRVLLGEEIFAICNGSLISARLGAKAYLMVGECRVHLILWCIGGL